VTDIIFNYIKAFNKLGIFKHDADNGNFKYFPHPPTTRLILKFMINQTITATTRKFSSANGSAILFKIYSTQVI